MLQLLASHFSDIPEEKEKLKPVRKVCFRKECENLRTTGKLYCSSECAKKDKEEHKLLKGIKDESSLK
jgi:hypothetical protein